MILLLAALLNVQDIPTAPDQAEIVVIGQRLAHWTGTYKIRGSKLRCATKVSTGDRDVDALGCKAFEICADPLAPRIAKSDEKSLADEDRASLKAGIRRDLAACVDEQRIQLIAQLAQSRRVRPRK